MKSMFFSLKESLAQMATGDVFMDRNIENLKKYVDVSIPLYYGNIADQGDEMAKSIDFMGKSDLPVKWAYDRFIVFWEVPRTNGRTQNIAALILTEGEKHNYYFFYQGTSPEEKGMWALFPGVVIGEEDFSYQTGAITTAEKMKEWGFDPQVVLDTALNWWAICIHINVLINCKNIRMVTNKETGIKRVKRVKSKKKRTLKTEIEFKTLVLDLTEKQQKELGLPATVAVGSKGFHLCRGHFKNYKNGKGLFGRYKGVYWWLARVRGTDKSKIIVKDYEIK